MNPEEIENQDKAKEEAKKDEAKVEEDAKEASQKGEVLEKGTTLDPKSLMAKAPGVEGTDPNVKKVSNFKDLKKAIENAKDGVETTIIVTESFKISETLTIGKGKNIILTSNDGKKMDDPWEKIEQPKDHAKEGEEKQRKIIQEAEDRGDEAIKAAETGISGEDEYTYTFGNDDIVLINKSGGTLFDVQGELTLGNDTNSINFDGNEKVGTFFDVQAGGKLTLKNGVIANGKNTISGNAPVKVNKGAKFIMEGGRITANEIKEDTQYSLNAGAVYVSPGGQFIMNNGMIDHNKGGAGAIFAGSLDGAEKENLEKNPQAAAIITMKGGSIVSNEANGMVPLAGGIAIYKGASLELIDGIIGGNINLATGGGVFISDGFVYEHSNALNHESAKTKKDYKEYLKENKAKAEINGGLVYANKAGNNAGGFYIDSENVKFNSGMVLYNTSTWWGGGIYYSFPPRVNKLDHMLVTDNEAKMSDAKTLAEQFNLSTEGDDYKKFKEAYKKINEAFGGPGNGGGIWNCPTGYVHIGDGHSLYIYGNKAQGKGRDLSFTKKVKSFLLNDEDIKDKFYSHVSPITERKNIIKFINDAGNEIVIPDKMSYTNDWIHLRAIYSEALIKEAWSNSNVFVLGNKSAYGGGIGSNANLETPDDEGNIDFKFKKKWHDIDEEKYEKENLHIDIFIVPKDVDEVYVRSQYQYDNSLYKYGEVILNKGNNWEADFSAWKKGIYNDLPVAKDNGLPFTNKELADRGFKYLIVERETGYATNVEQGETTEAKADGSSTKVLVYEFTIHNSPYAEAKIKKVWDMLTEEELRQALGDSKNVEVKTREIPDQVTFYVLKDGKRMAIDYKRDENGKVYPVYKTVTLTKAKGWEGVITKLDPILLEKGAYGIEEEALEGFKASYEFKKLAKDSGYEYLFLVTNQELPPERPPHEPPEEPKEPPHEPPEEPEEPPVTPPEEPEEPPVIPPEVPEEPPVIPEKPPVTPKKPGGAPQTGVESVGSYILLAMTSTLGLGYMRRKKH